MRPLLTHFLVKCSYLTIMCRLCNSKCFHILPNGRRSKFTYSFRTVKWHNFATRVQVPWRTSIPPWAWTWSSSIAAPPRPASGINDKCNFHSPGGVKWSKDRARRGQRKGHQWHQFLWPYVFIGKDISCGSYKADGSSPIQGKTSSNLYT